MSAGPRNHLAELRRRGLLPDSHRAVLLAGSRVRGWGNPGSDVDLYVVSGRAWPGPGHAAVPVALRPDTVTVEVTQVGRERWDIQYWLDDQVDQLLSKVSWRAFNASATAGYLLTSYETDFLERLTYAVPVAGEDWLARRQAELRDTALQPILVSEALNRARLLIEDAIGQLRAGDTESAVLSARMALQDAVQALLAEHGMLAQSPKWIARQMREVKQDVLSFEQYWDLETMRSYDPADPARWVEEVVAVCRSITFTVTS